MRIVTLNIRHGSAHAAKLLQAALVNAARSRSPLRVQAKVDWAVDLKTHYWDLAKNTSQLLVTFAPSNLRKARKRMIQVLQA